MQNSKFMAEWACNCSKQPKRGSMKRKFATGRRIGHAMAVCLFLVVSVAGAYGQADNLVRNRLQKIAMGEGDQVRQELPDLLADFPNDPGVTFLHASLVDDASRAVPLFEKIVREYPKSEWADDAQWRLVQIYAVLRDADRARAALHRFQTNYPNSEYLIHASGIVKMTVGLSEGDAAGVDSGDPNGTSFAQKPAAASNVEMPARAEPMQIEPSSNTGTAQTETPPASNGVVVGGSGGNGVGVGGSGGNGVGVGAQPTELQDPDGTRYTLQVGLYSSAESAQAELGRFTRFRMRAEIIEKKLNGATKYAVTIGDYSSRESAERARATVKKYCMCTPFIVARG